jgi:hypothetical protein
MSEQNAQNQPPPPPSKEEVIKFFQEQVDVKKVQYELQELNTKLAVAKAEELKALSFIAQMTNPKAQGNPYEGGVPHTITEEDLELNPELTEQGIKVGDEVMIPAPPQQPKEQTKEETKHSKKRGLKVV